MNIYFSIYDRHTKPPADKSYICKFTWPPQSKTIKVSSFIGDGRISGLSKHNHKLITCCGSAITSFNLKNYKYSRPLFTNRLLNQLHSVFVEHNIIYVCSTGLDLLLKFDDSGKLLGGWNPKFNKNLSVYKNRDFRNLYYKNTGFYSQYHINHVLVYQNHIYVLAGMEHQYYKLNRNFDVMDKIIMRKEEGQILHDGIVQNNHIIFTGSNGYLYKWHLENDKLEILKIANRWIRGLCSIGNTFLVGKSHDDGQQPSILQINENGKILKIVKLITPMKSPQIFSIIPQ